MKLIQNIECGNVFDYNMVGYLEALEEAMELYDVGDPTNECGFWDYYKVIEVE